MRTVRCVNLIMLTGGKHSPSLLPLFSVLLRFIFIMDYYLRDFNIY